MNLLDYIFSRIMKRNLYKNNMLKDPFRQFKKWFFFVKRLKIIPFYDRMTLSTVSKGGVPNSRIVLLKAIDNKGFIFFTNYKSNKSIDIQLNPNASLLFYWPLIERQVRINGRIEKVSVEESESYFKTRPRKSQIGAWASKQSCVIHSKKDFEDQIIKYTEKYKNKTIPCPPIWGGYRLVPSSFEFWQARVNRLHDRFLYTIKNKNWIIKRLSP